MHIILTGATGNVGAPALKYCLATPKITQLSILARRQFALPVGEKYDTKKAQIIIHKDYTSYPEELTEKLKGAEGCVWAQGVSQTEVTKDEYIRITHDYPIAAAKAFSSLSNTGKFNFVYVSGQGADPTEKTFIFYGKIKGRTEKDLLALAYPSLRIFNVRPAGVLPPNYDRQATLGMRVVRATLGPVLKTLLPGSVTPSDLLGEVLVELAAGDGNPIEGGGVEADGRTLQNLAIRRLGGL